MGLNSFKSLSGAIFPILWLGLAAGLQMAAALLYFHMSLNLVMIATYGIISFAIYLLNKFTDNEDNYNCPDQKIIYQQKSHLIWIPAMFIAGSVGILAWEKMLTVWHTVLIVCGVFYSVSLIPWLQGGTIRFYRIKDLLFVKNIAVSLLWGVTPFAICIALNQTPLNLSVDFYMIVAAFCLTTFINTTSCDVRDIEGDQHEGVMTVATRFGSKGTASILLASGAAGMLASIVAMADGRVSLPVFVLFMSVLIWTGIVALPIYWKNLKFPKKITEPLIDTQQLVCGLGLIILSVGF
jgi:4-hydroxybenzoate polyprenyltransferase